MGAQASTSVTAATVAGTAAGPAATADQKDIDPKEISVEDVVEWHNDPDLNKATKAFHDAYARQPSRRIEEARKMHHSYLGEIEQCLRTKKSCSRVEYTGSTYEGTKVAKNPTDDDLEFDVMIVMVTINLQCSMLMVGNK